jgi:hypothetical protein
MTLSALIERERARLVVALVGAGVAGGLAGAVVVAAAGGWLLGDARWLTLPRALPWLVWGVIVGAAAAAVLWTRARLRRDGAAAAVARAVEGERALRAGTVRGALEVGQQGPLGAMAAADVAQRLGAGAGPLAPRLQRRARGRFAGAAPPVLRPWRLSWPWRSAPATGLAALAHPWDAASGTLLPAIRWTDPPSALVRGQPLALRLLAPGRRTLQVSLRETGRPWRQLTVPVREDGAAALALGPTDADVALVATDGRAASDTLRVRVTDRAYLGDVTVQAEYPSYLARATETLAAGEPLRVPRGTALVLRGRASVPLQRVALMGAAGVQPITLPARGHVFEGRFVPTASGRWTWRADGEGGAVGEVPAPFDVQLLSDSAPIVVLASPGQDSTIDGVSGLRARVLASDDHGLASVALRTWVERADGRREAAVSTALAGAGPAWTGEAAIEPAAMSLKPGDRLHVQAVATDASPWRQAGTSREVVLKVPSASELRALARASADSAVAGASALASAQGELQRRTGDAARARTQASAAQGSGAQGADQKSQMSFQAAERAKGLAQEQRQLASRVEQLQAQAKGLERQLSQAGALDSALSRQMRDVQQMLRDAMTPEMAKQLQALERSAGQLSQGQARQSLEQLAAQQRAMREQLEKSAEMLKRAALEGAMQTLRDEATELATEQRREAERLDGGRQSGQQQSGEAGRQRELAQRSRELGKDIDQLGDRLEREKATVGAERVAQAEQHADRSADAMQRAAAAAQRGADPAGDRRNAPERRDGSQAQEQAQRTGEQRAASSVRASSVRASSVAGRSRSGVRSRDRKGSGSRANSAVVSSRVRSRVAARVGSTPGWSAGWSAGCAAGWAEAAGRPGRRRPRGRQRDAGRGRAADGGAAGPDRLVEGRAERTARSRHPGDDADGPRAGLARARGALGQAVGRPARPAERHPAGRRSGGPAPRRGGEELLAAVAARAARDGRREAAGEPGDAGGAARRPAAWRQPGRRSAGGGAAGQRRRCHEGGRRRAPARGRRAGARPRARERRRVRVGLRGDDGAAQAARRTAGTDQPAGGLDARPDAGGRWAGRAGRDASAGASAEGSRRQAGRARGRRSVGACRRTGA